MKLTIISILISCLITMVISCVERSQYIVIEEQWKQLCKKLGSRPFTYKDIGVIIKEVKSDANFRKIFSSNMKEINDAFKHGQEEMEKYKSINYCSFKETGGNKLLQTVSSLAIKGLTWCTQNKQKIERYLKTVNTKDSNIVKTLKKIESNKKG